MSGPVIRGWCPGAWRPMRSGDGLVVRIRPRLARLGASQVLGLCALAQDFGSGVLDLTNRANLQIRGVEEHEPLLAGLAALDLLDADPALESRRNILVTPFWEEGDLGARLATELMARLHELPELPAKVGFAVDTGPRRLLAGDPADFRFERGTAGLILRADGCALGLSVSARDAISALIEMAHWFDRHRSERLRRMAQVVVAHTLPAHWATAEPVPQASRPMPGPQPQGALLGAGFGQIDAAALAGTMRSTGARALRVTPWRLFLLEGAEMPADSGFITVPGDPLLRADACPGAPFCPSASVATRGLARALAPRVGGSLHVSGCAKGCARARPADVTLVGRDGRFDLVAGGCAGDVPRRTGLTPTDLMSGTQP